jgi:ribosomal protein L20
MRWPVATQEKQERVEDVLAMLASSDLILERAERGLELASICVGQAKERNRQARELVMRATKYEYMREVA